LLVEEEKQKKISDEAMKKQKESDAAENAKNQKQV
jgi:hypothetical protein